MPFLSWFKCLQRQDREDFIDVEDFMITKIIPPEIMEFIFAELNLKDIRICSRTCYRWQHIISAMFKDKSEFYIKININVSKRIWTKSCQIEA